MKIPCIQRLPFIVLGLSFLQPELTRIQFNNLTMIATALVLGSKFNLTEISCMWLKEKVVSTLSHFLSDAKFSTVEMQHLYILQTLHLYKVNKGYFLIDDTMKHHTKFCKWIHGVFVLFDHALMTNLKATCIVFLYYVDGESIKYPITFGIFYKKNSRMNWMRRKRFEYKPKYELALEMIEWALKEGFPSCVVLADSWFGIEPFIKGIRRLKLSYVIEIRSNYKIRTPCTKPKLTPTGKLSKKQYELKTLHEFFESVSDVMDCGFSANKKAGKNERVLYHTKIATVRLNAISGKHRLVESIDPAAQKSKYLISDKLTWEAVKMISVYALRWNIEEFFRNAKQLTDMEGATIRSEQGVTLALCLVSWIDFLLHHENYKLSTAGKLTKESLTIPSIVRNAQYENLKAFLEKVRNDEDFVDKWLKVEKERIERKRKKRFQLVELNQTKLAA